MGAARGEFSSRFGFLMAASGSAVGLGNIWGFPTNAASNGGAAFLFIYLFLAFTLAYPALMAELIIGRHTRANAVSALQKIASGPRTAALGKAVGFAGIVTVSLILCFYAIVSGWMLAWLLDAFAVMSGAQEFSSWLRTDGVSRNAVFAIVFMALTVFVISAGVRDGIEKWASRLMPALIVILALLIVYVMTLDGAMDGCASLWRGSLLRRKEHEMQQGIQVLIERMDSHPEEFFGDLAFRWAEIMQDIAKHGPEFLEEDDLMMLNKKVKEVRRKEFNAKVLDEIASAERLTVAQEKFAKAGKVQMNPYQAPVKQSGGPVKNWWVQQEAKGLLNKAFDEAYHDYNTMTITSGANGTSNLDWASEHADRVTIDRIRKQNAMLEMELAAVKQEQADKDARAQAYKKRKNQGWFKK